MPALSYCYVCIKHLTKMGTSKATLKKDLRTNVSRTLEEVFRDFEPILGKRKFHRNIKKASKVLTASVKPHKTAVAKLPAISENN